MISPYELLKTYEDTEKAYLKGVCFFLNPVLCEQLKDGNNQYGKAKARLIKLRKNYVQALKNIETYYLINN